MIVENFYLNTAIILLAAYLIGAFPSAYITGRIKGINIYKTGSGNVGGMNTISGVGMIPGIIVIITDIGKGFLVAYLADRFSGGHPFIPLWAVVAVVVGHNWMIYIGFKGGKGVAAFIGSLLYLSPLSFLVLYLIIIPVTLVLSKDTYLATTTGFFIFSFLLWIWEGSYLWLIFGLLITLAYLIKCLSLLRSYFTERRRDISPIVKKLFKPFFKGV
ncbi:MAG: glycerol-3-phosphate acyltransferase [Actinobacteria bacterium]|nr:glycerol-3-phosphate acyltransferase [Actinomycetota bacterium]